MSNIGAFLDSLETETAAPRYESGQNLKKTAETMVNNFSFKPNEVWENASEAQRNLLKELSLSVIEYFGTYSGMDPAESGRNFISKDPRNETFVNLCRRVVCDDRSNKALQKLDVITDPGKIETKTGVYADFVRQMRQMHHTNQQSFGKLVFYTTQFYDDPTIADILKYDRSEKFWIMPMV